VSGQHIMVPSTAVTSSPRQYTPLVPSPAAGPRSRSNKARNGATPIRRRAWASAPAVGVATANPASPAVSFAHTCPYPTSANNPAASSTYTTTREGRSRTRAWTLFVSASTASIISKGTIWVSSPR